MDDNTEHDDRPARGRRRAGLIAVASVLVVGGVIVAGAVLAPREPVGDRAEAPGAPATAAVVPGPSPDATPVDGSEVLPPEEDQRIVGVPRMTPEPPLVSGPVPRSGAATGELVDGYPTEVAGPLDGDAVLESAIAAEGTTMQVSLQARSESDPEAVRAAFRRLWSERGLVPDVDTDEQTTYRNETATLSLTVSATGTGTVYAVFGVLRAG